MIGKIIALDWRAIKVYQKRLPLMPVFIFIIGLSMPLTVIPVSAILFLSFSINPFAVEEKGELNKLYLTLPVQRKSIVAGRYMLSLIMLLCGISLGVLIMPLVNRISISKWYIGIEGYIVLISLDYLIYTILNLSMFPILFRLGYQKGKFWGFYLPTSFFAVIFSVYTVISFGDSTFILDFIVFASKNLLLVSGCTVVLATILLFLSYMVSVKLYSRRDF